MRERGGKERRERRERDKGGVKREEERERESVALQHSHKRNALTSCSFSIPSFSLRSFSVRNVAEFPVEPILRQSSFRSMQHCVSE